MLRKTVIALFATLALFASIDTGANARPGGSDCEAGSAYAVPRC
jgi:hypothetical protein